MHGCIYGSKSIISHHLEIMIHCDECILADVVTVGHHDMYLCIWYRSITQYGLLDAVKGGKYDVCGSVVSRAQNIVLW